MPRLLITGPPRSGTRWIALALRSAGLRVGHERLLRDGMVSSLAAVDDFYYVNQVVPATSSLDFDHVWLQTRDPLLAIPSIAKALRIDFWRWQEKHTHVPGDLEPRLLRAMLFWTSWIPKARSRHPEWQYRLEDASRLWPEMLDRLGISPTTNAPILGAPGAHGSSGATPVTYSDLVAIDRNAAGEVAKLAHELGYGG